MVTRGKVGFVDEYKASLVRLVGGVDAQSLINAAYIIAETNGVGTVYLCGNGGSAALANHLAIDLMKAKRFPKLLVQSLCGNEAVLTAIGNDSGYDRVFVEQIEGRLCRNDVLVCISGSGNSCNVVLAAEYAKENHVPVITLTGFHYGRLQTMGDVNLRVWEDDMQLSEDMHLIYTHILTRLLCEGQEMR